ncbi:hypothetical protein V2I01_36660 [Micromonospora sp. BRA006-A]|nr:hypothetical protein [Micromonospora sp. BRA006-A]
MLLGLLGLAAAGLILATRLRIEFDGWRDGPAAREAESHSGRRPLLVGLTAAALVVVLGVTVWASLPWLRNLSSGTGRLPNGVETSTVFANTWVPPLMSTLVAVTVAALAGFGIGALRPLGRYSELLLVPFAPWLFVGVGPLAVAGYERTEELGQLGLFLGLVPPVWLSVPALFAFTLLFRGRHARAGGTGRTLLLPALPMLAVTALPTWLAHAQSPLWATLVSRGPDSLTAPVLVQTVAGNRFGAGGELPLGLILPLPMLVLFVLLFAALMVGYLERLAIRVGRPSGTDEQPAGADEPVRKVTAWETPITGGDDAPSVRSWHLTRSHPPGPPVPAATAAPLGLILPMLLLALLAPAGCDSGGGTVDAGSAGTAAARTAATRTRALWTMSGRRARSPPPRSPNWSTGSCATRAAARSATASPNWRSPPPRRPPARPPTTTSTTRPASSTRRSSTWTGASGATSRSRTCAARRC